MWRKLERSEISRCYKVCFLGEDGKLTQEGRVTLRDIMATGGEEKETLFNIDPLVMAANTARQSFAKRIFKWIFTDGELFKKVEEEIHDVLFDGNQDLNMEIMDA